MSAPPKEDPAKLALRARPAPVTRLNRRTLVVLVGGLGLSVLLVTLWAFRAPKGRDGVAQETHNVERVMPAEGLQTLPSDYRQVPIPPAPIPEGDVQESKESEDGAPLDQAARAEQQRLRAEAEAAAKAQVMFQTSRAVSSVAAEMPAASAPAPDMPFMPGPAASQDGDEYAAQNRQTDKQAFIDAAPDSRIYGSAELQTPRSPYQLMAGTVIPAALVTGIRSDLPGDAIATVTESVYDSATGQHLLIPQGARLLGRYNSQISFGQERVQVVWNRVILPDASSLVLDNLMGTDATGRAGLEDQVDWHWGKVLAGAAMTTLLGVGAELAAPENRADGHRIIIAGRDSLQESVNRVGQELTRRNLNVQPTLAIRPGTLVRIIVSRDLIFSSEESR